ncbi:hypothetical protein [Streptococcus suis]
MKDIVDLYLDSGDFRQAVRESGLPVHVAHLRLLQSGALKIQDKINFGSKAARLGGQAEELFQKLVPDAVDANRYFQKNHPVYDFMFGNLTIDVKYSSLHRRRESSGNWQIRVKGNQDFIVAFLERDVGTELQNPLILLLPMQFLPSDREHLHISQMSVWFQDFQLEPEELQPTLRSYSELREEGLF